MIGDRPTEYCDGVAGSDVTVPERDNGGCEETAECTGDSGGEAVDCDECATGRADFTVFCLTHTEQYVKACQLHTGPTCDGDYDQRVTKQPKAWLNKRPADSTGDN